MTRESYTITPSEDFTKAPNPLSPAVQIFPERSILFGEVNTKLPAPILSKLAILQWRTFATMKREVHLGLVSEFLHAVKNLEINDLTERVLIKGKRVSFSPETIREVLALPAVRNCPFQEFARRGGDQGFRTKVLDTITNQNPSFTGGRLRAESLKEEAKFWSLFVNSNITPSSLDTSFNWEQMVGIYCIMRNRRFDAAPIIYKHLTREFNRTEVCLPSLITKLCHNAGVTEPLIEPIVGSTRSSRNLVIPQEDHDSLTSRWKTTETESKSGKAAASSSDASSNNSSPSASSNTQANQDKTFSATEGRKRKRPTEIASKLGGEGRTRTLRTCKGRKEKGKAILTESPVEPPREKIIKLGGRIPAFVDNYSADEAMASKLAAEEEFQLHKLTKQDQAKRPSQRMSKKHDKFKSVITTFERLARYKEEELEKEVMSLKEQMAEAEAEKSKWNNTKMQLLTAIAEMLQLIRTWVPSGETQKVEERIKNMDF